MTNDDRTKRTIDADFEDADIEDVDLENEDTPFDPANFDPASFDPSMLDEGMLGQVQEMMGKLQRADELEGELNDLRNKYARLMADFENYRRRTNQDVLDAKGAGISKAVEELLPVYDDLARALEAAQKDPASVLGGLSGVQGAMLRTFEKLGLTQTGAEGEVFDPALHEALQVIPGERDGVIVQVYQSGFKLGDKLVRPARVVVEKAST